MPKKIYGIKQKYNIKDYVKYYRGTDGNGKPCNIQFGYINAVSYECNIKGEIELSYTLCDYIGARGGYLIRQKSIIRRAREKVKNYGYRDYIKAQIATDTRSIEVLTEKIKKWKKTLEELDKEE